MDENRTKDVPLGSGFALGERYEVLEAIGEGAAAQVYRVRDQWNGAVRAAKVLRAEAVENEHTLTRFEDEYRILRGLHHPGLPEVHDYGWIAEESRFMIMELVDGEQLNNYLVDHPEDLWMVLYELCEVLSFIHGHNLLHQDIKPSNILVKRTSAFGGEMPLVMLMDFGLTYRRDADMKVSLVGTPTYMAPEIIRGETPLTRAVDYYSLGVTLYEILAGRPPFGGTTTQLFAAHLNEQPWFEEEHLQYTELYPHALALMSKDPRARLEAFEKFRRETAGKVGGTVDALERAIGIGHIRSLGLIGHQSEWEQLSSWISGVTTSANVPHKQAVVGAAGTGKTYLVERAITECILRGARVYRVGSQLPAPGVSIDTIDKAVASGKRIHNVSDLHAARWNAIGDGEAPAVVMFENVGELTEDDREFLRYTSERIDLAAEMEEEAHIYCLISGNAEEATAYAGTAIVVQPTAPDDAATVHTRLGKIFHTDDADRLREFIRTNGDTMASLVSSLEHNVTGEALRYQGGEWHVSHSLEASPRVQGGLADFVDSQLAGLPGESIDILRWASCQPTAISLEMLSTLAGRTRSQLDRDIDDIARTRLIELVDNSGEPCVAIISNAVRSHLYQAIAPPARIDMHTKCISFLEEESGENAGLVALGHHYARVGRFREMVKAHLEAIRQASAPGDSSMQIRQLYLFGLEQMTARAQEPMLARYYLKQAVAIELAASNFRGARSLFERYRSSTGKKTLLSMIYPYSRSLFKQSDRTTWGHVLEEAESMVTTEYSDPYLRVMFCEAMYRRQLGETQAATELAEEVFRHRTRLSGPMEAVVLAARTWVSAQVVQAPDFLELAEEAQALTIRHGLIDEYVALQLAKASHYIDLGKYTEAMREVVNGMRWATRHHLYDRQYNLRFKASNVYYELGDYERALGHVMRAHRLAVSLGDRSRSHESVTRFAMNYELLASFGNALRFAAISEESCTDDTNRDARAKTIVFRWKLMVSVGSEGIEKQREKAEAAMEKIDSPPLVAYYHWVRGKYERSLSQTEEAVKTLKEARIFYEKANYLDDATRVMIDLSMYHVDLTQPESALTLLGEVDENLAKMESENIYARALVVKLHAFHRLGLYSDSIDALVEAARNTLTAIGDVTVRLNLGRVLFQVLAELKRTKDAEAAFEVFLEESRKAMGSFDNAGEAQRYADVAHLGNTMAEYEDWKHSLG